MDLRGNTIKMEEILAYPGAKAVLKREFPEFMNPFMLQMSKNMTLAAVLALAANRVPQAKIEKAVSELEAL